MRLEEPDTVHAVTQVFLRIHTSTGIVGHGCASADLENRSAEHLADVDQILDPDLHGADPLRPARILNRLERLLDPPLLAAVDMALYDIIGKHCNLPVWKLLGGFRDRIRTSVSVGVLPVEETVYVARDLVARGFRCLRLMGGINLLGDIARVRFVRQAVGRKVAIRFNANNSYTTSQALRFIEATRRERVEVLEQPIADGEQSLPSRRPCPAALTELCRGFRLIKNGSIQVLLDELIHLRLMSVGGIQRAIDVNAIAAASGVEVIVGSGTEAGLGIAAGIHVALARPTLDCADLDGSFSLIDDPTPNAFFIRDGVLYPNDEPGLGVTVD